MGFNGYNREATREECRREIENGLEDFDIDWVGAYDDFYIALAQEERRENIGDHPDKRLLYFGCGPERRGYFI